MAWIEKRDGGYRVSTGAGAPWCTIADTDLFVDGTREQVDNAVTDLLGTQRADGVVFIVVVSLVR